MRLAARLALAVLSIATPLASMTYYVLEVKGGSRIYSIDQPARRGRLLLFHRYPDGVYMSVSTSEVDRVASTEIAPKVEKLAPGETVFIGNAVEGPSYEAAKAAAPAEPDMTVGSGYGGWWSSGYGGYIPPPRPHGPPPSVPSRIGPNGFPILAPPGSPGSRPLQIGPNGFPVIAPQTSR